MNRLQNSIVQFLKYVIELENLIILLNIGSLSFLRVSFIVEAVYNRKPLNRDCIS